eukprot:COSAG01_NODE_8027_length_2949_cov_69.698947_2_plen_213_part_00
MEAQRAEVAEQGRQQQQKQAAEAAAELEVSSIPLPRSASLRGDFDWASPRRRVFLTWNYPQAVRLATMAAAAQPVTGGGGGEGGGEGAGGSWAVEEGTPPEEGECLGDSLLLLVEPEPEPEPAPAPAPIEAADVATAARSQRVTQLEAVSPPSSAPRPPGAALPDGDWTTASRGVSYHAIVIDVDTKDASLVRTPCPSPPQRRCSHKHPTPS